MLLHKDCLMNQRIMSFACMIWFLEQSYIGKAFAWWETSLMAKVSVCQQIPGFKSFIKLISFNIVERF